MRAPHLLLLFPFSLHLFFFVVSILTSPSMAKVRASGSSVSAAGTYTLHLLQPHPNQRVYSASDSAGDVFLNLKFAPSLSLLPLTALYVYSSLFQIHCERRERGRPSRRKNVFACRKQVFAPAHAAISRHE